MRWPEYVAAAVGVAYASCAVGYWLLGQNGLALAYLAYSVANVGLICAALGR